MHDLPLIPAPRSVAVHPGTVDLRAARSLTVSAVEALVVADQLREDLRLWAGVDLPEPTVAPSGAPGGVHLALRAARSAGVVSSPFAGEHEVAVSAGGVQVAAAEPEGLYRGATSVVQLAGTGSGLLPHLVLQDGPAFGWRGLSLDVTRHFVPASEVRRVIDVLALYKFSVLHLHLTDNEGWRLEIRSRPALTAGRLLEDGSRAYYTQEEFAELVAYARARFVTVVPEIDLPGHASAVLQAYPELGARAVAAPEGSPFPVANLDGPDDLVWSFVDDVLTEVVALTPGPYLHVGGDEAFGMDPQAHAAFVTRWAQRVRDHGKTVVGWQEASRAQLPPGQVLQHWIDFAGNIADRQADAAAGGDGAGAAASAAAGLPPETVAMLAETFVQARGDLERIAAQGSLVLLSPNGHAYLDRPHAEPSADPAQAELRGRLGLPYYPPTPLRAYVEWDPTAQAGPLDRSRIAGVEGAVWCETVTSVPDLEALLLPRLPGVAQAAWGEPGGTTWPEHRDRLASHAALWDRLAWHWYQDTSVPWRTR